VKSTPTRSRSALASNPSSISSPFSGFRSGFPYDDVRAAEPVFVPRVTLYVTGAVPACPHAPRSFRLFTPTPSMNRFSVGSSDAMYDSENFG
jgi:hypothetical protein